MICKIPQDNASSVRSTVRRLVSTQSRRADLQWIGSIALAGKTRDPARLDCRDLATETGIESNLAEQQKIVSDDVGQYFQFYPVISIGFGYKF